MYYLIVFSSGKYIWYVYIGELSIRNEGLEELVAWKDITARAQGIVCTLKLAKQLFILHIFLLP